MIQMNQMVPRIKHRDFYTGLWSIGFVFSLAFGLMCATWKIPARYFFMAIMLVDALCAGFLLYFRHQKRPATLSEKIWLLADKIERTNEESIWPYEDIHPDNGFYKPEPRFAFALNGYFVTYDSKHNLYIHCHLNSMSPEDKALSETAFKESSRAFPGIQSSSRALFPQIAVIDTTGSFDESKISYVRGTERSVGEALLKILMDLDSHIENQARSKVQAYEVVRANLINSVASKLN